MLSLRKLNVKEISDLIDILHKSQSVSVQKRIINNLIKSTYKRKFNQIEYDNGDKLKDQTTKCVNQWTEQEN